MAYTMSDNLAGLALTYGSEVDDHVICQNFHDGYLLLEVPELTWYGWKHHEAQKDRDRLVLAAIAAFRKTDEEMPRLCRLMIWRFLNSPSISVVDAAVKYIRAQLSNAATRFELMNQSMHCIRHELEHGKHKVDFYVSRGGVLAAMLLTGIVTKKDLADQNTTNAKPGLLGTARQAWMDLPSFHFVFAAMTLKSWRSCKPKPWNNDFFETTGNVIEPPAAPGLETVQLLARPLVREATEIEKRIGLDTPKRLASPLSAVYKDSVLICVPSLEFPCDMSKREWTALGTPYHDILELLQSDLDRLASIRLVEQVRAGSLVPGTNMIQSLCRSIKHPANHMAAMAAAIVQGRPVSPETGRPLILAMYGLLAEGFVLVDQVVERIDENEGNDFLDFEHTSLPLELLAVMVDDGGMDAPIVTFNEWVEIDAFGKKWALDAFGSCPLYSLWKQAVHAPVMKPVAGSTGTVEGEDNDSGMTVIEEIHHDEPAAEISAQDAQEVADEMHTTWISHNVEAVGIPERRVPSQTDNAFEPLLLLRFSRSPPEFQNQLHEGPELEVVRARMQEFGCNLRLPSGATIFVYPEQYEIAKQAVSTLALRHYHIVTSETFVSLIVDAASVLASRRNVRLRSLQTVAYISNDAEEDLLVVERTFLNTLPRVLRSPDSVTQSTSEVHGVQNPRRRS